MGKIISIVNQKGGVGKTTTTVNLGVSLSLEGKKILIIDFDQEANATITLGIKREQVQKDIVNFLFDEKITTEHIVPTGVENVDIICASLRISMLEQMANDMDTKELMLRNKLEEIKNNYDYILIDYEALILLYPYH